MNKRQVEFYKDCSHYIYRINLVSNNLRLLMKRIKELSNHEIEIDINQLIEAIKESQSELMRIGQQFPLTIEEYFDMRDPYENSIEDEDD